jgi:hypothetical protein
MGAPASPSQGPPRLWLSSICQNDERNPEVDLVEAESQNKLIRVATMEVGQDEPTRSQRSFLAALSQARQAKSQMAKPIDAVDATYGRS